MAEVALFVEDLHKSFDGTHVLKGIDLRTTGSGNIGATNVVRAVGWGWGITTLLIDAVKGAAIPLWVRISSYQATTSRPSAALTGGSSPFDTASYSAARWSPMPG